jgi:hypothetical protein
MTNQMYSCNNLPTIKLRERLESIETYAVSTCSLLDTEINTERFKKALNEALDKRYKYVVGELNYGDSHSTDPRIRLQRFKDKDYQIVSFVLVAGKDVKMIQSVVLLIK